jgi:general L-amino acid transport system substrate-binding protein
LLSACFLRIAGASTAAAAENRLAEIQARGVVNCGIWPYVPGFATERDGRYVGFDVDICHAVAAAVLGDATKVSFVMVQDIKQFSEHKDIDLAVRRLTWTVSRETQNGMAFGPVTFYDGQGFLVARDSGIKSASQLAGERICVIDIERHPDTLYRYFHDSGRKVRIVLVESDKEAEEAMRDNRCRAYSADVSWLAAARSGFAEGPARYEILPDQISKEPLAPLMRAQDVELLQMVRWTIFSMIQAEELGLTSRNVDSHNIDTGSDPSQARLRAIVAGVGNYGEVFERNLGADSAIKLDRGLNRLWSQGGLLYAPPLDR